MASKVIVHSVPRSGSMLIHDLYTMNGYTPYYQDNVDLDCNRYSVHTHLSRPWLTSKYINEFTILVIDRHNLVDQVCSYIMSSSLNEWHIFPELKSDIPDLKDIKSFNYSDQTKRGALVKEQAVFATERMITMKRNQKILMSKLSNYKRMMFEDFIEDGLEVTCSKLGLDPTNCRWNEHRNPRKFEDVFINQEQIKEWITETVINYV